MDSIWFVRRRPRPEARLRLFAFPYAGVGASAYRAWFDALPPWIELVAVQPPGRETRLAEPAFADLNALVAAVAERVPPLLDRPFALFGHSMGALVAFELARGLQAAGVVPERLIVSARRAPDRPYDDPPLHVLPDDAFVAELQRRYGGIPEQVLRHDDLLALLLPGLRADVEALERHAHVPGAALACPISAFGGDADPRVGEDHLAGWARQTGAGCDLRLFPGGHFYFQSAQDAVIDAIESALDETRADPVRRGARA